MWRLHHREAYEWSRQFKHNLASSTLSLRVVSSLVLELCFFNRQMDNQFLSRLVRMACFSHVFSRPMAPTHCTNWMVMAAFLRTMKMSWMRHVLQSRLLGSLADVRLRRRVQQVILLE
ncbi:hypothetical protein OESDEN_23784 [Oesophagostomum dentatum]|uniref:Uncharacterized protein n=1 Tax=Oesophagostomum dentatum TaxID=61180 RepID=A0A0B1RY79_OESDE|nr:hypothetical protein OESDEN_23784 [Oesophagostomum dentatum]